MILLLQFFKKNCLFQNYLIYHLLVFTSIVLQVERSCYFTIFDFIITYQQCFCIFFFISIQHLVTYMMIWLHLYNINTNVHHIHQCYFFSFPNESANVLQLLLSFLFFFYINTYIYLLFNLTKINVNSSLRLIQIIYSKPTSTYINNHI